MNKIISRIAKGLGLAAAAGVILVTAACGDDQPVSYAPAAYGQNGVCYYVDSPAEVTALQAQGLCPRSWAAGPMPISWLESYYPYYDSPSYYNVYVPSRLRTTYVSTQRTFYRTHTSDIRSASSRAVYHSSTGKTVRGTTVIKSKTTFGSGTAGTSFGSGKRSSTTSGTSFRSTTRTSFGSSSRSFGGGKR